MNKNLLSTWNTSSSKKNSTIILPDGCRDLIMKIDEDEKPFWFISPLYDKTEVFSINPNSVFSGYRMKPGVIFSEKELIESIQGNNYNFDEISNRLNDYTSLNHSVEEALNCLASNMDSVKGTAKTLGVSSRTLQRLISKETARTPAYWILLARARRAARTLVESSSLADIAEMNGYADQAHMSREFKRWFALSPSLIRNNPNIINQLFNKGYD
jgi:AraC-like DNA-binding protein